MNNIKNIQKTSAQDKAWKITAKTIKEYDEGDNTYDWMQVQFLKTIKQALYPQDPNNNGC